MNIDQERKMEKELDSEMDSKKSAAKQREQNQLISIQDEKTQEDLRVQQERTSNPVRAVQQSKLPHYPPWPTSRPGPLVITPGVGQRPINPLRPEQIVEVGYNQAMGTPTKRDSERY